MLDIKILKQHISNSTLSDYLIVFLGDNDFLVNQYIHTIAKVKNKKLRYIDDLKMFDQKSDDIFDLNIIDNDYIYIFKTELLEYSDKTLLQNRNLFIVAKNISDAAKDLFENNILKLPALENWHIKDYAYSKLAGISNKDIDWLLDVSKYDIYRIDQEIHKFNIFPKTYRQKIFTEYIQDNGFDDLSSFTIFNLTNAIITKNIAKLRIILSELKNIDINAIGLITVLHDNIKKIIDIQINSNATAETLNINPKQFTALRYNCGYYNKEQLIKILKLLTDIDIRLKTGALPAECIINYIIVKILGV